MEVDNTLSELVQVGIELSTEKDTTLLLEKILNAAKRLSRADGGTIYGVTEDKKLKFDTLFNDSLGLYMGGSSGKPIPFDGIPIYEENGDINTHTLVSHAAGTGNIINIEDVYAVTEYDLSGPRKMDEKTGYHTQSVLCIPMKNHEGDLNGVLQLINAQNDDGVVPFDPDVAESIRALASLAAVALTNRELIDSMEQLFQSFTRLIAKAIDEKSPYTGGHCRRVPELTMMIADAVCRFDSGPMAEFDMTEEDKNELSIAGWLHDCGKIATPEYVMDKSKKLEAVFDRIEMVVTRFELAQRDIELHYLRQVAKTDNSDEKSALLAEMEAKIKQSQEDCEFVRRANTGGEFMTPEDQARIEKIGKETTLEVNGATQPLLTDEEIYNLQIARGTLNNEERQVINRHMDITISMLESLPFPKHLQRVPEYAGGHHEKMDGTGYPKGLTKEQMSIPARMMAIADIFEALTASDRPYKPAKKVSECLKIMGFMCKDQHIDPDLFEIFVKEKVYEQYSKEFLSDDQYDEVKWENIPGFQAFL
ncbi:MAG: HD domain-containing protein [Alteromonadaceae bacterium]|nr:HD domain-containing protein [Alteromonadaceae bacterium]